MKTLLRWVGGKLQLVEQIVPHFPSTLRDYIEPCVGSGVVLLDVLRRIQRGEIQCTGKIRANDINQGLINFFQWLQRDAAALFDLIHAYEVEFNETSTDKETFYYRYRTLFNTSTKTTQLNASYFYIINRLCFRGLYREGRHGLNTSFGFFTKIIFTSRELWMGYATLLQPVEFTCVPIHVWLPSLSLIRDDFMYIDPPYYPINDESFNRYVQPKFELADHQLLFTQLHQLPCRWIMSNADIPIVRTEFKNYTIQPVQCRRTIHGHSTATQEILIINP
jgi:DNA adenine methylase